MKTPFLPATSADPGPIGEFAQCHTGIMSHLKRLRELPAMLEPAAQARRIATDALAFFRHAVCRHHQDEERELFPAVVASAALGSERARVEAMVGRLTAEHRRVEAAWERLEPGLKAVAKGRDVQIEISMLVGLVDDYLAHAQFEEGEFLPLARLILGRNSDHMAALGLSLHARHVLPDLLRQLGPRG